MGVGGSCLPPEPPVHVRNSRCASRQKSGLSIASPAGDCYACWRPRSAMVSSPAARVGRPYPGFFVAPDFRVFPSSRAPVAVEWGDRIVSVEGRSPVTLEARAASGGSAIRYEIERAGHRVALDLAPQPFTWRLLFVPFGFSLA